MKKKKILFTFSVLYGSMIFAQVGINTNLPNGALEVQAGSNNYGLVNPRVTNTGAVSNPQTGNVLDGTMVYDLSENCLKIKANDSWSGCMNVPPGTINSLGCDNATHSGGLTQGRVANITVSVPYTGGNGGNYGGISTTSTGVTGLTATNSGGSLEKGDGILVLTITGTPATGGTATFQLNLGGQTCSFSLPVTSGTITGLNCTGATVSGTFTPGTPASGTITISYSGGNGGSYDAISSQSTGVTGMTATTPAGSFANGAGTIVFDVAGVPSSGGLAVFPFIIGGQSCSVTVAVKYPTITIITIGNGAGYFPSGSTYYNASGGTGIGSGNTTITNAAAAKWGTVVSDVASTVEYLSFIPGTGSAAALKSILQDPNKKIAMIYNVYNSLGTSNNAAINQVVYDNWISKGKIYFVSADEGGFTDDLVYWKSDRYGVGGGDSDSYSFDAALLMEQGDTFPIKYGAVSSTISLKPGGGTANAFTAAKVPSNAKIVGYKTQGDTSRVAVFKDMNYGNGKLWVFSDTDAYWQYDNGGFGSSPYLTQNSCTATARDQFTCNLFYYVTRKNLGIPLN